LAQVVLVTLKFIALPTMWFHYVFVLVLCVQWHPSASSRLRKEGGGKEAAMDDVLKVAQGAHKAAEIYAQAKHSAASNSAANDVYLANAMTRGSLDQDAFVEVMQAGNIGACPDCLHDYAVACPGGWIPTHTSSACEALDGDYTGPCPMELFVKEMTANEKANMEIRCSVCWPCKQDVAGREPVSGNGPVDPSSGEVIAA